MRRLHHGFWLVLFGCDDGVSRALSDASNPEDARSDGDPSPDDARAPARDGSAEPATDAASPDATAGSSDGKLPAPDRRLSDTAQGDGVLSDAALTDGDSPDASSDGQQPDAAPLDASSEPSRDGGHSPDVDPPDTSPVGPQPDAATADAALADAALADAGLSDAALADAGPPRPYLPQCDLLTNGGAETGDLTGWTLEDGQFESRAEQLLSIPAPASGDRLFFAGRAPQSRLYQDAALAPFAELVDGEMLYATLSSQVRTWDGSDRASLELHALDPDGQTLARVVSDRYTDAEWQARQIGLFVPRGTVSLRAVLVGERLAGQDNDAYFDDVSLCVSDAPPPPPQADARVPPYLMWAAPDGVSVLWETEAAVRGYVDVDGRRFEEAEAGTMHELRLTGLEPATEYLYVAGQGDEAFAPSTFRTAPVAATPFDFVVWADNQNGPEVFARLVEHMVNEGPDWAASVGDCVQWGLQDLYRTQLLRPIHELASFAPFLVAAGNHERLIDFGASLFNQYMAQPGDEHCFGYRYGEAFFMFIDTELSVAEGSPQYACIEAALDSEAARTATLRAALFHKPPRVEYWAGFCYTGEASVRDVLTPLFARAGVNIVFNGHNHLYAYTPPGPDGITWVTTGGGGGAIDGPNSFCRRWEEITETQFVHHFLSVHVEAGRMIVRAIDEAGEELHRFEVAPAP